MDINVKRYVLPAYLPPVLMTVSPLDTHVTETSPTVLGKPILLFTRSSFSLCWNCIFSIAAAISTGDCAAGGFTPGPP